jgi:hypothetical protein
VIPNRCRGDRRQLNQPLNVIYEIHVFLTSTSC